MGKHYCDYCDVYLTHDSTSVRKSHNTGRNHLQNVRDYYASLDPMQNESIFAQVLREYERKGLPPPNLQPHIYASVIGPYSGEGGGGRPGFGAQRGGFRGGYGRPPPNGGGFGGGFNRPPPGPPMGQFNRPPPGMSNGGPQPLGMRGPPPNYGGPPPGYGGR